MPNIKIKSRFSILIAVAALDGVFFSTVNPTKAPAFLFFAGFALVACSLLGFWCLVFWGSRTLLSVPKGSIRKPAVVASVVSLVLLALQSVGQLTIRDVTALVALVAILWFYMSYSRERRQ